jgi:hypothetical protein
VALVAKEDKGFCRHTETVESQYWERDGILPDVTNHTVINVKPGSDSDRKNSDTYSQSDYDNSETASEYNNTTPDEDTDMELAQPLWSK